MGIYMIYYQEYSGISEIYSFVALYSLCTGVESSHTLKGHIDINFNHKIYIKGRQEFKITIGISRIMQQNSWIKESQLRIKCFLNIPLFYSDIHVSPPVIHNKQSYATRSAVKFSILT